MSFSAFESTCTQKAPFYFCCVLILTVLKPNFLALAFVGQLWRCIEQRPFGNMCFLLGFFSIHARYIVFSCNVQYCQWLIDNPVRSLIKIFACCAYLMKACKYVKKAERISCFQIYCENVLVFLCISIKSIRGYNGIPQIQLLLQLFFFTIYEGWQ